MCRRRTRAAEGDAGVRGGGGRWGGLLVLLGYRLGSENDGCVGVTGDAVFLGWVEGTA